MVRVRGGWGIHCAKESPESDQSRCVCVCVAALWADGRQQLAASFQP